MPTLSSIPVTVTPEAAERVAELGMQGELEQMLEHTRQTVTGLQKIKLILEPSYDMGDDPFLTIEATRDQALCEADDSTRREWSQWFVRHFTPDVVRHFGIRVYFGANHAG